LWLIVVLIADIIGLIIYLIDMKPKVAPTSTPIGSSADQAILLKDLPEPPRGQSRFILTLGAQDHNVS
jgi:hypothetical protein